MSILDKIDFQQWGNSTNQRLLAAFAIGVIESRYKLLHTGSMKMIHFRIIGKHSFIATGWIEARDPEALLTFQFVKNSVTQSVSRYISIFTTEADVNKWMDEFAEHNDHIG